MVSVRELRDSILEIRKRNSPPLSTLNKSELVELLAKLRGGSGGGAAPEAPAKPAEAPVEAPVEVPKKKFKAKKISKVDEPKAEETKEERRKALTDYAAKYGEVISEAQHDKMDKERALRESGESPVSRMTGVKPVDSFKRSIDGTAITIETHNLGDIMMRMRKSLHGSSNSHEVEAMANSREIERMAKSPEGRAAFSKELAEGKVEHNKRRDEIMKIMSRIGPEEHVIKYTVAQLKDKIADIVTDPVDLMRLKLKGRSKSVLETIYTNVKATKEWQDKNKPGKTFEFSP